MDSTGIVYRRAVCSGHCLPMWNNWQTGQTIHLYHQHKEDTQEVTMEAITSDNCIFQPDALPATTTGGKMAHNPSEWKWVESGIWKHAIKARLRLRVQLPFPAPFQTLATPCKSSRSKRFTFSIHRLCGCDFLPTSGRNMDNHRDTQITNKGRASGLCQKWHGPFLFHREPQCQR
jgi:hypothetical protein